MAMKKNLKMLRKHVIQTWWYQFIFKTVNGIAGEIITVFAVKLINK